jgi:putative membrane protein
MNQLPPDQQLSNPRSTNDLAADRTELAKYRSCAAADRTLMAWIRTSLSLIGFGFGIPTIVKAIERTRIGEQLDPIRFSVIVGLSFIAVGIFAMSTALREHRRTIKLIQSDRYTYESSSSAQIVGLTLLLIGLVSFLGVVLKAI